MTSTRRSLLPGRMVLGLALVGALVLGVLVARGGDEDDGLSVHAVFADASPLLEGNDVRMNGVRVGTISSLDQAKQGTDVEMTLDPEAQPIFRDATARIRPDSLLGERYIDIDPGSPDAGAMAEGGTIPLRATSASTDLDMVLNALDEPTAHALAALVGTLGTGLDGNGVKVREAITALAPALTDTDAVVRILREQDDTLGELVTALESVASGLAVDEGEALDRLVGSVDSILASTAVREEALRSVIDQLPSTVAAARRTLGHLERASVATVPTLRALRPTTRDLADISAEIADFADAAEPALESANPVLRAADALLDRAMPVARTLREAGPRLTADARSLDPLTRDLTRDLVPVFEFIRGWALTTNGRDGLSHYFRANVVLTTGMVTGAVPSTQDLPLIDDVLPNLGVDDLLGNLPIPGLNGPLPDLLGDEGPLGGLLSPKTARDGGVTGLTPRQEMQALDFMLGGRR